MIDKRGREYLKTAKPAPITADQRQLKGRPAIREQARIILKQARWRNFRKVQGASRDLSFRQKLVLIRYALKGEA